MDRRRFLKISMGTAGATLMATPLFSQVVKACALTPDQVKGPFYPLVDRPDENTDLTRVDGKLELARGEVHYVLGTVLGVDCLPLSGALVEIWQACESGRYDHEKDSDNSAELDPNFQYWGETLTDEKGSFQFKTIKPGSYPADVGWDRPPHIHFKVSKRGYRELITQMYFKGEALNDLDLILQDLSVEDQTNLVVDFAPSLPPQDAGSKTGTFTLTLQKVKRK